MPLTRRQYWGILLIGIVAFVAIDRIWENPFAIDTSIIWSYVLVAALVPGALLLNGTLTTKNFILYEIELLLLKYAITTCIAVVLWASTDPPPRVKPPVAEHTTRVVRTAPPPTQIDPAATGTVTGVVRFDGVPAADVLVFIDAGLDDVNFPIPETPVVLRNDGRGFTPRLAVLRTYQSLELVVDDGQLHTIAATNKRGENVISIPMVANGRRTTFDTDRALGVVTLTCRVHEKEGRDHPAHLVVLAHPFWTTTDKDGRYTLDHVPAAPDRLILLRALRADHDVQVAVTVQAGETVAGNFPEYTADGIP